MSRRGKSFEEQLSAFADQMSPLVDQLDDTELSEELLLDYYAGVLSPEETERVGRLAAFSSSASDYLAQLALDETEAAEATTPRAGWTWLSSLNLRGLTDSLSKLVQVPQRTLALAGSATAAILAILIILPPLLQGPPDFGGQTHRLSPEWTTGQGKDVVTLPGNQIVGDVDASWPLHTPIGDVESLKWFVWDSLAGAETYRLELFDATGNVVFRADEISKPNTKLKGVEARDLTSETGYVWLLEAFDGQGTVLARGVGRFQIVDQ